MARSKTGERHPGAVAEIKHVINKHEAEKGGGEIGLEILYAFETLNPISSDPPPLRSLWLLILPKQFHQFGTKYSNI